MIQLMIIAVFVFSQMKNVNADEFAKHLETITQIEQIAERNGWPLDQYAFLEARKNGLNENLFSDLIDCESRWNPRAIGDKGLAYGILQFHKPTFNKFSDYYGMNGQYKNPYSQLKVGSKMLGDALWEHWYNCSKKIGAF